MENLPQSCIKIIWWRCQLSHSEFLINTLGPRQYGCHLPDDIFKCISFNENVSVSIEILLKYVPNGQIYNIPALVQIMAWHRPSDKPLSAPMVVSLLTHKHKINSIDKFKHIFVRDLMGIVWHYVCW